MSRPIRAKSIETVPEIPTHEMWARLLHRDYVGQEAATRRKQILVDSGAYSISYWRQVCREHDGPTDTGYECHLSRTRRGFSSLLEQEPGVFPQLYRLASVIPDGILCDVVRRGASPDTDLLVAASQLNDHTAAIATAMLRALSPESRGGVQLTPEEAAEELPAVDRALVTLQDFRRKLQDRAAGRAA